MMIVMYIMAMTMCAPGSRSNEINHKSQRTLGSLIAQHARAATSRVHLTSKRPSTTLLSSMVAPPSFLAAPSATEIVGPRRHRHCHLATTSGALDRILGIAF